MFLVARMVLLPSSRGYASGMPAGHQEPGCLLVSALFSSSLSGVLFSLRPRHSVDEVLPSDLQG